MVSSICDICGFHCSSFEHKNKKPACWEIRAAKYRREKYQAEKLAGTLKSKKGNIVKSKVIEPEFIMPTGITQTVKVPFYHFGVAS